MFLAAVIGWAMTYGMQRQEINTLKQDTEDVKQFVKEQVEINAKMLYIIDHLAVNVGGWTRHNESKKRG